MHIEYINDFLLFWRDYAYEDVYDLKKEILINQTGEFNISTTITDRDIAMMMVHSNCTV